MPGFLSRWWGWFQSRSGVEKALFAVVVLIVLVLLSRVVWAVTSVGFVVALIVVIYRFARRRPVRAWAIATVVLLAVGLIFGAISSAVYGPDQQERVKAPRVQKPATEKKPAPNPSSPKLSTIEQGSKSAPPETKGTKKPAQDQQERSLYEQAVQEPLAPYKVGYTVPGSVQRLDVYVVTETTTNKPRLGRILIDLQEHAGHDPDLVTASFCAKPGEQSCNDTMFAYGEYAATAQGKSFMTGEQVLSKVGEWPFIKVEL